MQNRPELYSVPVAGGAAAVKLSPAQTNLETNRAGGFVFSSDGSQVLFAWSNGQIYRIPPTGGTPTSLTPSVIFPSFVNASAVSSTGYVIYGTGTSSSQDQELYSIPLTGGSATLLNSTFGGGFSFLPEPLLVSADGSRVIYQTTTGLASSPVAGGSAATLATFSASQSLYGVKVGGGRVVYAFRDTGPAGTVISIASVPVAGGSTATLASGLADDFFQYDIVGNGTQVAYVGRTAPETRNGLFVVPTTGGVVTTLDDPSVTSHATRYIESSPTANRVAYVVRAANGIEELYSTPLA
ncbi:MAG: hypothetical protein MUD01_07225, partial [Chloroflexaceae bacterium]|nr:hypothetical protein [Chloroflexaceae bacterium]